MEVPGVSPPAAPETPFSGVVAVDGPSGAGKSTVSRLLASRLGARYLDTGAMYRAVTWAVLQAAVSVNDAGAVADVVDRIYLDVSTNPSSPGIAVDGRLVDEEIRSGAVTTAVSAVSAVPEVRRQLVHLQRELIGVGGIVVEGRDIGSVVVPDAVLKVFLTASEGARAGRRSTERGESGPAEVAATVADLGRRDRLDSTRAASPLLPAPDAVLLDTTDLGIQEVVEQLLELVAAAIRDAATTDSR